MGRKDILTHVSAIGRNVLRVETENLEQVRARLAAKRAVLDQRRVKAIKEGDLEEIYETSSNYIDHDIQRRRGEPFQRSLVLFNKKRIPLPVTEPQYIPDRI